MDTPTRSVDRIGSSRASGSTGLLVSVRSWEEVEIAVHAGVDWLDLKEPLAGPLGRPDLHLVRKTAEAFQAIEEPTEEEPKASVTAVRAIGKSWLPGNKHPIPANMRWSVAGGELLDWNWDQDIAYLSSLRSTGAIKWALARCGTHVDWPTRLEKLVRQLSNRSQAILVHYADWKRCDAPDWSVILKVAGHMNLSYVLIDTAIKDGTTLLDHCSLQILHERLHQAHELNIGVALAGSISLDMLPRLLPLHPQWLGLRGALCSGPDRTSPISSEKIRAAARALNAFGTNQTKVQ